MKSGRVCFRTRLGRGNLAVATLILGKSASASFVSEDRRVCIGGVIFTFLPYFVPVGCFLKTSDLCLFLCMRNGNGNNDVGRWWGVAPEGNEMNQCPELLPKSGKEVTTGGGDYFTLGNNPKVPPLARL